jgi:tetratricopeptide (TPR) repeat protein
MSNTQQALAYLQKQYSEALNHHQNGRLEDAEKIYQSIIKLQPRHADALHGLGLIDLFRGKPQEAIKWFNQALKIEKNATYFNNRGSAYFEIKKMQEALADYQVALKMQAEFTDAQYNLANLYSAIQKHEEAINAYSKILQKDNHQIDALYNRGNAYKKIKKYQEAIKDYLMVLQIEPNNTKALLNLGNTYLALEDLEEAINAYDKILKLNPSYPEVVLGRANALILQKKYALAIDAYKAHIHLKPDEKESYYGLGNALKDTLKFEDAIYCYKKAIEIDPEYFDALTNLANTLRRVKRFDESALYYSRAVEANPNEPDAYSNLGNILHDLNRTDLAIDAYAQALVIAPNDVRANYNIGNIYKELNQFEEAIQQLDHVLTLNPDDEETLFAKGIMLLTLGKYREGFQLYEKRWERESLIEKPRDYPQPFWNGTQSLEGKTILIHIEQGLGDTIQFCRLLYQLENKGAKVVFEVQKPLIGLMNQVPGVSRVISYKTEFTEFDYYCPLLSLPHYLNLELDNIPLAHGYLNPLPEYLNKWQLRLGPKKKPRVGLICSGNKMHENDQNRSILLFEIIPYLPQEFEYITLQKEMRDVDRQLIEKYPLFKSYGDELDHFEDTAALCELMDIVISVDTSVAHLSGAIGKKTWLLIPFSPDWRWMLDRKDTPWYQSMTIYRQESMKNWAPVFAKVAIDLKKELKDIQIDHE